MDIPAVFEDNEILVLDKPSGMVVNRAESVKGETVQDYVHNKYFPGTNSSGQDDFYLRDGIVHRLDKETSGLLIVAKTPASFVNLQAQFKERVVEKKYLTLVHGKVKSPEGEIRASVGRLPWNRERFGVLAGGRPAVTFFKVKGYYLSGKEVFTYLEVFPHTGRTHQIRIHLKYMGYSVVSDKFYAGRKTYRHDQKIFPRLFLHACYIKFNHPVSGLPMEFKSELPEDLSRSLKSLTGIDTLESGRNNG